MDVVHADRSGQGRFAVHLETDAVRCDDVHLVGILGRLDRDVRGLPSRQRRWHVLYHEAEVIDDAAGGSRIIAREEIGPAAGVISGFDAADSAIGICYLGRFAYSPNRGSRPGDRCCW